MMIAGWVVLVVSYLVLVRCKPVLVRMTSTVACVCPATGDLLSPRVVVRVSGIKK